MGTPTQKSSARPPPFFFSCSFPTSVSPSLCPCPALPCLALPCLSCLASPCPIYVATVPTSTYSIYILYSTVGYGTVRCTALRYCICLLVAHTTLSRLPPSIHPSLPIYLPTCLPTTTYFRPTSPAPKSPVTLLNAPDAATLPTTCFSPVPPLKRRPSLVICLRISPADFAMSC